MSKKPQAPCCPKCGSVDITSDATARWSVPAQRWEISTTHDPCACDDCGAEFDEPRWAAAGSAP